MRHCSTTILAELLVLAKRFTESTKPYTKFWIHLNTLSYLGSKLCKIITQTKNGATRNPLVKKEKKKIKKFYNLPAGLRKEKNKKLIQDYKKYQPTLKGHYQ